jgi:hypothetical protein
MRELREDGISGHCAHRGAMGVTVLKGVSDGFGRVALRIRKNTLVQAHLVSEVHDGTDRILGGGCPVPQD